MKTFMLNNVINNEEPFRFKWNDIYVAGFTDRPIEYKLVLEINDIKEVVGIMKNNMLYLSKTPLNCVFEDCLKELTLKLQDADLNLSYCSCYEMRDLHRNLNTRVFY